MLALALCCVLLAPGPAWAAAPTISLPSPSATGQQITVSGTGFCPEAGCSGVSVTVDQRVAAAGVAVAAGGTFSVAMRIIEMPGQYSVVASQQTPGGQLSALHGLVVVAGERQAVPPPGAATPPAAIPTATGPPPAPGLTGPPESPGPSASPPRVAAAPAPAGSGGPLPWWAWATAAAIAAAAVALAAYIARRRR